jgi:two-component system sensor histidine kinase/response regulator
VLPIVEPAVSQVGNIMIVDDNPANLKLLEDMLAQNGYQVRSFPRGRLAVAAAAKEPPDLILLDINMPGMNGYEACEILKSTRGLSDIPVIFLSALNETQDKVKAFQSGGIDYISKPFQFEEVQARVKTHLNLHHLQRGLKRQNERLEDAVAVRTRELAEAHARLTILDRSKSDFLNLISHELRTPLNGLFGAGELIFDQMPSTQVNNELQGLFKRSQRRILGIVDDALLLTEIDVSGERFTSGVVSLSAALSRAIKRTIAFAESRHIMLSPAPDGMGHVVGDEDLLVRALHALLETAIKFSEECKTIWLTREVGPDSVRVLIESEGRTIPSSALQKFFDVFSIGEAITPGGDLGLSAPVAYRILALFGASVSVENREPSGIRLTISLRDAMQAVTPTSSSPSTAVRS